MIRTPQEMTIDQRAQMRGGTGTVTIEHLLNQSDFSPGANCRLCAKLTLPPGASIGPHEHLTEDEVYYITAGEGLLDDGETQTRVTVGDAILTGNGASHSIANTGETDLEFLAVIVCYGDA